MRSPVYDAVPPKKRDLRPLAERIQEWIREMDAAASLREETYATKENGAIVFRTRRWHSHPGPPHPDDRASIADLDGGDDITPPHVSEAIQYRSLDCDDGGARMRLTSDPQLGDRVRSLVYDAVPPKKRDLRPLAERMQEWIREMDDAASLREETYASKENGLIVFRTRRIA